jgi:DNA repair protein RadC
MKIDEIYKIQKQLSSYHGSCLLQNIPELAGQELLAVLLGDAYEFYTVSQTRKKLLTLFSEQSISLQSAKFEEAMQRGDIVTGAQRTPENKRLELCREYNLYELLQVAFSPDDKYFHINPKRFKK